MLHKYKTIKMLPTQPLVALLLMSMVGLSVSERGRTGLDGPAPGNQDKKPWPANVQHPDVVEAAEFVMRELARLSRTYRSDNLVLGRIVNATNSEGAFHFMTHMQLELTSPTGDLITGTGTASVHNVIVMDSLRDGRRSLAIDEYPKMKSWATLNPSEVGVPTREDVPLFGDDFWKNFEDSDREMAIRHARGQFYPWEEEELLAWEKENNKIAHLLDVNDYNFRLRIAQNPGDKLVNFQVRNDEFVPGAQASAQEKRNSASKPKEKPKGKQQKKTKKPKEEL